MRKNIWIRAIFPAIGAYVFFALQFLVPSVAFYKSIKSALAVFGVELLKTDNPSLFVAIILFFPYIVLIGMYFILLEDITHRFTIRSRLAELSEKFEAICRYHASHPIVDIARQLISYDHEHSDKLTIRLCNIVIDLLITDIRDAFQFLCQRDDIRVAIFVETTREIEPERNETVLSMIATTEFDNDYKHSTFFRKPYGSTSYQGFCGAAWDSRKPQSGAYRKPFTFMKDSRFFLYNPQDKKRSFLCLPVMDGSAEFGTMRAVVTIDSGSRLDFMIGEDLRNEIFIYTKPFRDILNGYISILRFT